jgi:lipoate---protein ligase
MEGGVKALFPASPKGEEVRVCFEHGRDPVKNLIREEELFLKVERRELPAFVRFWMNSECLVRGRVRSAKYGWYNEPLAREMGIQVVERSTGGGVVYQDEGNLNWSVFLRNPGPFPSPAAMFERASAYMVRTLERLGVEARFASPNRIDVFDRKVSGMAARSTSLAALVHGTLLLDSNLDRLNRLCLPPAGCPPVANVCEWKEGIDAQSVASAFSGVLKDSGCHVEVTGLTQ